MKTNKLFAGTALALLMSTASAAAANIDTNTARMQAMDKITGRVSEIDVPVNGESQFGSFSIVVRKCVTRSPEETPENTAFVDVVDNYNPEKPVNIFKGWMMSSTPALNAVEHPIYDVWLLKCYNSDAKGKKLLTKEELEARDNVPMQLAESSLPAEENKPAEDVKVETAAPAAEETAAVAPEKAAEKPQPQEVVSVVVTGANEDTVEEDGAPKALLQIEQVEPETASKTAPTAETQPAAATEEPATEPESAIETPEEDGFISFDDDEEDDAGLSAEALVSE